MIEALQGSDNPKKSIQPVGKRNPCAMRAALPKITLAENAPTSSTPAAPLAATADIRSSTCPRADRSPGRLPRKRRCFRCPTTRPSSSPMKVPRRARRTSRLRATRWWPPGARAETHRRGQERGRVHRRQAHQGARHPLGAARRISLRGRHHPDGVPIAFKPITTSAHPIGNTGARRVSELPNRRW